MPLALLRFEDRSSKKMPKLCESAVSNFAKCISEDSVNTLAGRWFSAFGGDGSKRVVKSNPCLAEAYMFVYIIYTCYTHVYMNIWFGKK